MPVPFTNQVGSRVAVKAHETADRLEAKNVSSYLKAKSNGVATESKGNTGGHVDGI